MEIKRLGLVDYDQVLTLQRNIREELIGKAGGEALLLVEHPQVITLGRGATESDMAFCDEVFASRGIEIKRVDRGGKATYHGPGQAVAYPILDLSRRGKDLRAYVNGLEDALISTLSRFGVRGSPSRNPAGVFVRGMKIGSVGVSVRRWVTQHGVSLNVDNDLEVYNHFSPCGFDGSIMTRLADHAPAAMEDVFTILGDELKAILDV